ncbi:MAG: PTS transporter subunit EIIC [Eggerthellaceae bacterium]|nr:PTS transporter subunit EIIC [Eggerthellaceae bacterium]
MALLIHNLAVGSFIETLNIEKVESVLGVVEVDAQYQVTLDPAFDRKCKDVMDKGLEVMPKVDKFGKEVSSMPGITIQEVNEVSDELSGVGSFWESSYEELKAKQKQKHTSGRPQTNLKYIANIFVPLIPVIAACGLCSVLVNFFLQIYLDAIAAKQGREYLAYIATQLFCYVFISFFIIFVSIVTAKECSISEAMGGLIGAIGLYVQIVEIAKFLNWHDETTPLQYILQTEKGEVLAVMITVFLMSYVYKFVTIRWKDFLNLIAVLTLMIIIIGLPHIFLIKARARFVSNWIQRVVTFITFPGNMIVRAVASFVFSVLFLPLVLLGLCQALIPFYAIEQEVTASIFFFSVHAMACAGQVGTEIAICPKAQKKKNQVTRQTMGACILSGALGIVEHLIYGVTFLLRRPFITFCIGPGFVGAVLIAFWFPNTILGTSGILLTSLLSAANMNLLFFLCCFIGYLMGFVFTMIFCECDIFSKIES